MQWCMGLFGEVTEGHTVWICGGQGHQQVTGLSNGGKLEDQGGALLWRNPWIWLEHGADAVASTPITPEPSSHAQCLLDTAVCSLSPE